MEKKQSSKNMISLYSVHWDHIFIALIFTSCVPNENMIPLYVVQQQNHISSVG